MSVLAIDPGPIESAYVIWDGEKLVAKHKAANEKVLTTVAALGENPKLRCVIEQVCSFGMPVGADVFETVFWSGRFAQAFGPDRVDRIPRLKVKLHICHDSRARDAHIRQALIDRFGKPGTKKAPGALYGVSGDIWAALAVAVTWWDLNSSAFYMAACEWGEIRSVRVEDLVCSRRTGFSGVANRKGADMEEWPADLRVRQLPPELERIT